MSVESYSLSRVEWVQEQLLADSEALGESRRLLRERLLQAKVDEWPLEQWHGMTAVLSTLELCLAHLDSRIRYYNELINRIKLGEVENTDATTTNPGPQLSVIKGGVS